jgi:uncharacterized protein (TIGR02186 family)
MKRLFSLMMLAALAAPLFAAAASAQTELPPESLQIGLSTDTISINSNFGGTALTIFGALDGADPLIQRQGRYDLVVVLEGPEVPLVVRRKDRVFGVWVNTTSASFDLAPLSYIAASTRNLQDITDRQTFAKLALGVSALKLDSNADKTAIAGEFSEAFKKINAASGAYSESSGKVEFISQTLFRATLQLPASIPVGQHQARAYLFRNGTFIRESSADLTIMKSGTEQAIYRAAQDRSVWYGLTSVALAVLIGWLGNAVFRKG